MLSSAKLIKCRSVLTLFVSAVHYCSAVPWRPLRAADVGAGTARSAAVFIREFLSPI